MTPEAEHERIDRRNLENARRGAGLPDRDQPAQPPRIPPEKAAEYELVVDVKIMARTDFDRARAYERVRVSLDRVIATHPDPDLELDEIRDRYANGFGDIEVAAEDVGYLIALVDNQLPSVVTARQVLIAAVGSAIGNLIEANIEPPAHSGDER